ncbi:MAG: alanine--tRNA ligase [Woeseiaceae bacterium]|nr:alanine--tRNA ligase [Woeseiaceae bacterium]NIP21162.1 alanine--tRNA ligase [Woeseiaceae bacterium]NIS90134.1 alanine--tRNA ligase [Woeseiaceae bacterium]
MKTMTSNELRQAFLDFFRDKDHEVVASSPLVPGNDPTLLFTNAGMVQFKDVFLGSEKRKYDRAVTSQRCVRAGGKHNDLENVGYTARHHTFFEMLGNFSFGDYFKRDAIKYAWEFLTETLGLAPERLWVTVFEDDDEAADIWLNEVKIDPGRFSRMGAKDNFWAMGDTGPCGPCSEIFYDHGPDVEGGPPGSPDEDGDRYVEIWNLVFMQFDRSADGEMVPLPKPSVDTGMGLERMAAVMQGVHSNYEIDLFAGLIDTAAKTLGVENDGSSSLNVIADHIRACAFLIVDGVLPGNEGRGYVLRRIIRRAIRHGKKLGAHDLFFHKLVDPLVDEMGAAYPELKKAQAHVGKVLRKEEQRFAETLDAGMEILEEAIAVLDGKVIPGDVVFKLYDTYGFPVDLTADIARERGLSIDQQGFEESMEGQRDRGRAASKFSAIGKDGITTDAESEFLGYEGTEASCEVVAMFNDGKPVETLNLGEDGAVILSSTPFYAESGGQIGDTGTISAGDHSFTVVDTQKSDKAIVHYGSVQAGELSVGDEVEAHVDAQRRQAIRLNHSATHLMHAALREVLGDHVQQKGSLVAPDRLRFDFSHYEPVSVEQIAEIEDIVNNEIRRNVAAETKLMSYDDAVASGAIALFGEKYEDRVRVLNFGGFSVELCGGTHVDRTGDIGVFKITHETGIASGVRRIEAVTGKGALEWMDSKERMLNEIADLLKAQPDQAATRIEQLLREKKELQKRLATARHALITGEGSDQEDYIQEIAGIKVLAARVHDVDASMLREAVDRAKDKLQNAVIVLGTVDDGKVLLAAGVTKNNTDRIRAGDLIKPVAEQVGGKGGGRPDFAQAGGTNPEALDTALSSVSAWVAEQLG